MQSSLQVRAIAIEASRTNRDLASTMYSKLPTSPHEHSLTTSTISTCTHTWSMTTFSNWHLNHNQPLFKRTHSAAFYPPGHEHCRFQFAMKYKGEEPISGRPRYHVSLRFWSKKWFKKTNFAVQLFRLDADGAKFNAVDHNIQVTRLHKRKLVGEIVFNIKADKESLDNTDKSLARVHAYGCEISYVNKAKQFVEADKEKEPSAVANETKQTDAPIMDSKEISSEVKA